MEQQPDGTFTREPAYTPRAFCERDRGLICDKLTALPEGYRRLADEGGELRRAGSTLRMPYGPSIPLHEGMDALRRETALTLGNWHARVAAVARLTPPLTLAVLDDGGKAIRMAVAVLGERIDTLLGLEIAWMTRRVPIPPRARVSAASSHPDWLPSGLLAPPKPGAEPIPPEVTEVYGDAEIVRMGTDQVTVLVALGGADAGLEVLRLHRAAERLLGEVGQHAETLDGVPCRECEDMALERAEPPSDPSMPEMFSRCASCRHQMPREEYAEWAARYAKWAQSVALSCRRCQQDRHSECVYGNCACLACGHAAA